MEMNSFYLSRVLGRKVYTKDGSFFGKIKDLGVTNKIKNPKIEAIRVKTANDIVDLKWKEVFVKKQDGQYAIVCNEIENLDLKDVMFLAEHVLDKQIIDVNGRKVVRVNDIRLLDFGTSVFVVAADIGTEGILRRIGIAKPIVKLGFKVSSKLILWNDVEAIFRSNENIMLSKTYNKLSILYPSDLADIIEDFDENTGMMIFSSLDNAKAADVLEEMEEDKQLTFIRSMSTDKAADILEEMPADEAADILDGLSEFKAEELLNNMEKEASEEVRGLLEYDNDEVGSLMSTEFVSLEYNLTVGEAMGILRERKPNEDEMYYIYVVNKDNELKGTISLRDMIVADPRADLGSIMHTEFPHICDKDDMHDLVKMISKYNVMAIPVLDKENTLLGNVIINDVLYEILRKNKRIENSLM